MLSLNLDNSKRNHQIDSNTLGRYILGGTICGLALIGLAKIGLITLILYTIGGIALIVAVMLPPLMPASSQTLYISRAALGEFLMSAALTLWKAPANVIVSVSTILFLVLVIMPRFLIMGEYKMGYKQMAIVSAIGLFGGWFLAATGLFSLALGLLAVAAIVCGGGLWLKVCADRQEDYLLRAFLGAGLVAVGVLILKGSATTMVVLSAIGYLINIAAPFLLRRQ